MLHSTGFSTRTVMFIPRALRLKGIREPPRPKSKSAKKVSQSSPSKAHASNEIVVTEEPPGESTDISPHLDEPKIVKPDSRFTSKNVTSEYIAEVAAGIELIFTDYAHQESERAKWLQDHHRNIDEGDKCTRFNMKFSLVKLMTIRSYSPYSDTPASEHCVYEA